MNNRFFGVIAGVALLASVGVATAGQRAPLTDAQLDKVAAGTAGIDASASHAATMGNGIAVLNDNNAGTGHVANAAVVAQFNPVGAVPHLAALDAFAF